MKMNSHLREITPSSVWIDNSWYSYDEFKDHPDFMKVQEISGINIHNLASEDLETKVKTQHLLEEQSRAFRAVRQTFGDWYCLFQATRQFEFLPEVPKHNPALDAHFCSIGLSNTLRNRHFKVSSLLPKIIKETSERLERPITINSLASATGLDMLNALKTLTQEGNGKYVKKIINYDINRRALKMGKQFTQYFEEQGMIEKGIVDYRFGNIELMDRQLARGELPTADLVAMVAYYCGTQDKFAIEHIFKPILYPMVNPNGTLFSSSSNTGMASKDFLGRLISENMGMAKTRLNPEDPNIAWPLNCRTEQQMHNIHTKSGFKDLVLYDDARPLNQYGKPITSEDIDRTPQIVLGFKPTDLEIQVSEDVANISCNWIAAARKPYN